MVGIMARTVRNIGFSGKATGCQGTKGMDPKPKLLDLKCTKMEEVLWRKCCRSRDFGICGAN